MAAKQRQKKRRSALGSHRVLLALVMAATVLDILVSVWAITAVQEEMSQSAQAAIQTRLDQLYDHFSAINQSIKRVLVEVGTDTLLEKARSADDLTRVQARGELIRKFSYVAQETGADYSLFYYFPEGAEFIFAVNSQRIKLSERPALEQAIAAFARAGGAENSLSARWKLLDAGGEYYAVKLYEYQGVYAGSCIPARTLIAPLTNLYPGERGFPVLIADEGVVAMGGEELGAEGIGEAQAISAKGRFRQGGQLWIIAESGSQYLGFRVRLFFQSYGRFEQVVMVQAVALIAVALILSVVITSMAYTQRRILRPLRRFTDGLKTYDPDHPLLPALSDEIEELAAASEQFNNLTKEISRLRIDAYEHELERQKTQMDYMQLQIKPHFFLNSLNLIHTMAQRGNLEGVSALSENTAKYLRYIFQSDSERMPLAQELEHIRDFLGIMEIRYPGQFGYEIVSEPEAEAQRLPPLILQTFVENSIKYGMVPGRKLEIGVSALCESMEGASGPCDCLSVFITDNGRGFGPEQLEVWAAGGELAREGGAHIGIANALRRLMLAYQGKATVQLYNSPLGGAVVELHIPCEEVAK